MKLRDAVLVAGLTASLTVGFGVGKLSSSDTVKASRTASTTARVVEPASRGSDVEVQYARRAQPPFKVKRLTLSITAYTRHDAGMDGRGITFTGMPAERGTIAVDPSVIPLGSVVRVPGMGYFVALDTGGAIKGYKADMYVNTVEEALQWGRRSIEVEVIE